MTSAASRRPSRLTLGLAAVTLSLSLSGCGYNNFQRLDEDNKAAWAEVLN